MAREDREAGIRDHVEHLAKGLATELFEREYDGQFTKHLAPSFLSHNADFYVTISRDEFIEILKKDADVDFRVANDMDHRLRADIISTTTELSNNGRDATVWLTVATGGIALKGFRGIERECIIRMRWKKIVDGRWLCFRSAVMRGPGLTFFG